MISWGDVVSVFLYLLYFPSYDVISDIIMTDADCTPGREPRSVSASLQEFLRTISQQTLNSLDAIIYGRDIV